MQEINTVSNASNKLSSRRYMYGMQVVLTAKHEARAVSYKQHVGGTSDSKRHHEGADVITSELLSDISACTCTIKSKW